MKKIFNYISSRSKQRHCSPESIIFEQKVSSGVNKFDEVTVRVVSVGDNGDKTVLHSRTRRFRSDLFDIVDELDKAEIGVEDWLFSVFFLGLSEHKRVLSMYCMKKTKKNIETEKYVDAFIKAGGFPPTYEKIKGHFGLKSMSASYARCARFRYKMKRNGKR